jgi:hypothetical protein
MDVFFYHFCDLSKGVRVVSMEIEREGLAATKGQCKL